MLHIVQIVFAGKAETPRVFIDRTQAESAFVEHVEKCWRQSYSAWCERSGVGLDSFASATAFLDTLDLSEKSRINYWGVAPEDAGSDAARELEGIRQRREEVAKLAKQVEQRSGAVREELSGLLEDLARLIDDLSDLDAPSAEVQAAGPEEVAGSSPATEEKAGWEDDAEKYSSREWKAFVGTIMNLSGGSRSDFPPLPRPDWRQEVYSDATSLEYWDWVAAKIEKYRKEAEKAGFAVIEDPDSPGHYRFRTPEGEVGEASFYSQWEAWCHAWKQLPKQPAGAGG